VGSLGDDLQISWSKPQAYEYGKTPDIAMGVNSLFLEVHESNDSQVAYSVGKIDSQS